MKKKIPTIAIKFSGVTLLVALLTANLFVNFDGFSMPKQNRAYSIPLQCYWEEVGCVINGSAGTKSVCDTSGKGGSCECGTSTGCVPYN